MCIFGLFGSLAVVVREGAELGAQGWDGFSAPDPWGLRPPCLVWGSGSYAKIEILIKRESVRCVNTIHLKNFLNLTQTYLLTDFHSISLDYN